MSRPSAVLFAPPSAVLFDWDNTLVDSWACIQQAMNETLIAMGHAPWDLTETKSRVAHSLKNAFPGLFGERWEEARDIFYRSFAAIHLNLLRPLPGAADILLRLRQAGVPMAVISNKSGPFIRKETDFLGWTPYFKGVFGAGDASEDKPSPLPVRLALEKIGVPADHHVWFLGDAAVDMECAVNAGIRPVLVQNEALSSDAFKHCPPTHNFPSWQAFDRFLDEILISRLPI